MRFLCFFMVLLGIAFAIVGHLQGERRRRLSAVRGAVMSLSETIAHERGFSQWTRPLLIKSDVTNDVETIWESAGRPDVFVRIWDLGNDTYNVCAYERVLCGIKEIFSNVIRVEEDGADCLDKNRDAQERGL